MSIPIFHTTFSLPIIPRCGILPGTGGLNFAHTTRYRGYCIPATQVCASGQALMYRRHKYNTKHRKPRRRAARTEASKAKSLQVAWRNATDRSGTLPMEEARKIVADPPTCPYCEKPIPYREISIDHVEPRSKGGSSEPSNLVYCDRRCNQAKSNLTGEEFKALLRFLDQHPSMRENVLSRLVAGGAAWGRKRRWHRG